MEYSKLQSMSKVQNMLLGLAIGDAFGAGYEFLKGGREEIKNTLDMTKYKAHPKDEFKHVAGRYTDDTQMSIAICELLLSDKYSTTTHSYINEIDFADAFVSAYKRDPVVGYGKRLQAALSTNSSGTEFFDRLDKSYSGNGAAMRALPLGIIPNLLTVTDYAKTNARTTHNTPNGIASSVAIAMMSSFYLNDFDLGDSLGTMISSFVEQDDYDASRYFEKVNDLRADLSDKEYELLFGLNDKFENGIATVCNVDKGVPCDGVKTVGAVMYILNNYGNSPLETLKQSVLLGGDTDSVAGLALGLCASKHGLSELPNFLLDDLVNTTYGKDYIISLGEQLSKKFKI